MLVAIDRVAEERDPAEASAVSIDLSRHVPGILDGEIVDYLVSSLHIAHSLDGQALVEVEQLAGAVVTIGTDRNPEVIALAIDRAEPVRLVIYQLAAHVIADGVATPTEHDVGSVVSLAPEFCQSLRHEDPEWLDVSGPHRLLSSDPAEREVAPSLMTHRHCWCMPAVMTLECAWIRHDVSACARELPPDVWSIGELGQALRTAVSCRLADCSLIDLSIGMIVEQMLP